MIGLLLAMYPARWRRRYGEEFRAVLESRALGPFDVADVLIGALDARLFPRRLAAFAGPEGGHHVMLRIGGLGAIAGGLLWFIGVAVSSSIGAPDGAPWLFVEMVGTVGLLLALIGLSAFQAHRHPILVWAAFAIPALGALVSLVGLIGMALLPGEEPAIFGSLSAWIVWALGLFATVIGSLIFAVATIRAGVFSRLAALALALSSVVVVLVGSGIAGGDAGTGGAELGIALAMGAFAASWIALGVTALRRGPIRGIASA